MSAGVHGEGGTLVGFSWKIYTYIFLLNLGLIKHTANAGDTFKDAAINGLTSFYFGCDGLHEKCPLTVPMQIKVKNLQFVINNNFSILLHVT